LVQTGRFLTLPPPGETWGSGLTWLVRSGISGFPRNSVYPKSCRCSSKRSKRVQGGVLFDCAGFQTSSVLNHDRMVSWKGCSTCPLTVLASKTVGGQCFRSVDWPRGPIIPELSFLNSSTLCLALSQVRRNCVRDDKI
jgi:hypothetical protein